MGGAHAVIVLFRGGTVELPDKNTDADQFGVNFASARYSVCYKSWRYGECLCKQFGNGDSSLGVDTISFCSFLLRQVCTIQY